MPSTASAGSIGVGAARRGLRVDAVDRGLLGAATVPEPAVRSADENVHTDVAGSTAASVSHQRLARSRGRAATRASPVGPRRRGSSAAARLAAAGLDDGARPAVAARGVAEQVGRRSSPGRSAPAHRAPAARRVGERSASRRDGRGTARFHAARLRRRVRYGGARVRCGTASGYDSQQRVGLGPAATSSASLLSGVFTRVLTGYTSNHSSGAGTSIASSAPTSSVVGIEPLRPTRCSSSTTGMRSWIGSSTRWRAS